MRKSSKSAQIRSLLRLGNPPKKVAELLTVDIKRVYNENWKLKQPKKRKSVERSINVQTAPVSNSGIALLKAELATIEKQMDNLSVIASFLAIRIRQMEQK